MNAFRRRLAEMGGALGPRIGTFEDMYRAILARAGRTVPVVSTTLQLRLIRAVVANGYREGKIEHFAALHAMPGFILTLRERFAELQRAHVHPERLGATIAPDEPGIDELTSLYIDYRQTLQTLHRADEEGLSWLAIEALRSNPSLVKDWSLLVVDGFEDFTGTQRQTLQLLATQVPSLLITLPGTPEMSRPIHHRFQPALQELTKIPSTRISTLPGSPRLPESIKQLESRIDQIEDLSITATPPPASTGEIELLETHSPAAEAREALRWLKARIVREGIKPAECAVIVPNLDNYRPHLRACAAEFSLPLHFIHEEKLAATPPATTLLELLSLPHRNFPRRNLLSLIRSPYLELKGFGLTRADAARLDLVSHFGQVIEGRAQWDETLTRLAEIEQPEAEIDDEAATLITRLPYREAARKLQRALRAFFQRLTPPEPPRQLAEWIEWLEDLLFELHFFETADNQRDQNALFCLQTILNELKLSGTLVKESPLDYPGFINEISSTLESASLDSRYNSRRQFGGILVSTLLAMRGLRFRAVAWLGFAEGLLPETERADPFISESLRASLGLEPRLGRRQAGLFYQGLTRADDYLLLTRPYLADDGESWEPSPYWNTVVKLLGQDVVRHIQPDTPRPLAEAASPEEVLFYAVQKSRYEGSGLPPAYAGLLPRWQSLAHARKVLAARLDPSPQSHYEGILTHLAGDFRHHFGADYVWSASRLEAFGTCPYRFFVEELLELERKEPPEAGFDALQLGSMLHAILEKTFQQASDPGDAQSVLAILPDVATQEFSDAPQRYGFRPSARWEVEQEQLLAALSQSVQALAEYEPGWTPIAHEQPFGLQGHPPLVLSLANQLVVKIRGVIDRLDHDQQGRVRIIDYKTGSSHLAKTDLLAGRRLQLPIYALAAQQALGVGQLAEGFYWIILQGKAGSLRLSRFRHEEYVGTQGACEIVREHIANILAGVQAGHYPPIPPKGGCPHYCPAVNWCWRYSPGR